MHHKMKAGLVDTTHRRAALVSGSALLLMTVAAIYAEAFVRQKLVVPGSATTTIKNISENINLFYSGIFSFVLVILLDIVVAWSLYVLFRTPRQRLSLMTAWFRTIYAMIFAASLYFLFSVANRLNTNQQVKDTEQLTFHSDIMSHLESFDKSWSFGLIFFGCHLCMLGYLVFKSGYIARVFGVLLVIAGAGYLIDSLGKLVIPDYHLEISMITFAGELVFMFWLLIRGGKSTLTV